MKVQISGFLKPPTENEIAYFNHLEGFIESIDIECNMMVTKTSEKISIRIAPSHPMFLNNLIKGIKEIHTALGIYVNFAKSMKNSLSINFYITV